MITKWEAIRDRLREKIGDASFGYWFGTTECTRLNDTFIELLVATEYHRSWISDNYITDIAATIEEVLESSREVVIIVAPKDELSSVQGTLDLLAEEPSEPKPSLSNPALQAVNLGSNGVPLSNPLNPEYDFDSFVVGPSNQFAHAAAMAAAENPGRSYNPLFFYGGVGIGKTHLMCAIGHTAIKRHGLRVLYLTSEQFMNDLITSIERKAMPAFRERYRSQCDVLLIDDIQFIAGKERTQEEFFHTFNALHNTFKQIVITSDKTPQEIPGLEERLQSRFNWGLIADIQRPKLETRVAILKKKAQREGLALTDQVGVYMASHLNSNIRELEGCLRRMAARCSFSGSQPSMELAKEVLEPFIRLRTSRLTPERILKLIAGHFSVKISDIKGRGRSKVIAYPRQLAMFLARKHTSLSFPELGRAFGKDHSTIINAFKKIEALVENDPVVRSDIEALERNLLV